MTIKKENTEILPLEGVRILDLSRLLPGPLATMMLGDMGAEVIKIEQPQKPDYIRHFPPFAGKDSAYYLSLSRNKKSLMLDFTTEKGKQIFFDLVKKSDVIIEQFRPGVMEKMGLSYEKTKAVNPGIIFLSITGYGQTGPKASQAGHDLNYIAESGLLSQIGKGDQMPAFQIADVSGAYMTVNACLAALFAKTKTGKGKHVDISLMDACVPFLTMPFAHYTGYKLADNKTEMPFLLDGSMPNYSIYSCGDGEKLALGALEPKFWTAFCKVIDKSEWITANLFNETERKEIHNTLVWMFLTKKRDEWLSLAEKADCCLSPVLTLDEIEQDEQLKERAMFIESKSKSGEKFISINSPVKFAQNNQGYQSPPNSGEHTLEILKTLGYTDNQIEDLKHDKIIE